VTVTRKMGRPRKPENERLAHLSINVEVPLFEELDRAARADGDRPLSAFGRLLLTAAWRMYREQGKNGDTWLKKYGSPIYMEQKAARTA